LNDYLSERLQIRVDDKTKISKSKKETDEIKHVSMIYAVVMDVSAFMQVLIESNATQTGPDKKYMFKLPDQLRKYYQN